MTIDVQAIRAELADTGPTGVGTIYAHTPGSASPPAVVVGLPERIEFDGSYRLYRITLPIFVLAPGSYTADAETKLLTNAMTVAHHYRDLPPGVTWRSLHIDGISDVGFVTVGRTECMSAQITTQLLAQPTT